MTILKNKLVAVEIGALDATVRLPMVGRLARGIKTVCLACGAPITDDFFIGGFKSGHPNMVLHERCAALEGPPQVEADA